MKEKVVREKEISDEKKRESLKPHNRRSNTTKSRKKGGERKICLEILIIQAPVFHCVCPDVMPRAAEAYHPKCSLSTHGIYHEALWLPQTGI